MTVFLPWHSLLINGYLKVFFEPIVAWKEILVFVLFFIALSDLKSGIPGVNDFKIALLILFLFSITFIFAVSELGSNALYGFKTYFLPLIFIFSLDKLKKKIDWLLITKVFIINAGIMTFFAIVQQLFLGEAIYLNAGYPADDFDGSKLNFTFYIGFGLLQRGAGGFIAPIPYSVFLVISIVMINIYKKRDNFFLLSIINIIAQISLVLTFTRSSIVAYLLFFLLPWLSKNFSLVIKPLILSFVGLFLFFNFFESEFLDSIINTANSFFDNATKLTDSSSVGHFNSFEAGWRICMDNFFSGKGLGYIGPHTSTYLSRPIVLESAYLSVWAELGIFGCIVFFGLLFFYNPIRKNITFSLILIYAAVGFFLPINYYLELTLLFIIAIQIANNITINDYIRRKPLAGYIG